MSDESQKTNAEKLDEILEAVGTIKTLESKIEANTQATGKIESRLDDLEKKVEAKGTTGKIEENAGKKEEDDKSTDLDTVKDAAAQAAKAAVEAILPSLNQGGDSGAGSADHKDGDGEEKDLSKMSREDVAKTMKSSEEFQSWSIKMAGASGRDADICAMKADAFWREHNAA